jgi:hypothetical protein
MARTKLSSALLGEAVGARTAASSAESASRPDASRNAKTEKIDRTGLVNISAYYPAEVKSALRIVQAKTGKNVKQLLGEALNDLFRKYNVATAVPEDH